MFLKTKQIFDDYPKFNHQIKNCPFKAVFVAVSILIGKNSPPD